MKVLLTGVAGKLGRLVAHDLIASGHEVLGIDRRPWPDAPEGVLMFNADIRKRPAEDVFRTHRPDAVIHMATVSHVRASDSVRYRINLKGTQAIFKHCARYQIKQCVFVGRHTYYGAAPDSPLYHSERDPPLAVSTFPALADMVAADLYAGTALWEQPDMNTAVLRVCYTLGPSKTGTLAQYIRGPRVPTVLGFDPLFQFMHEVDVARAIRATLQHNLRGIFNVAGPQPVPLSLLLRVTERQAVPLPEPLFQPMLGRLGLPKLPKGSINHVKYPVVVDAANFQEATGFEFEYDEVRTMQSFRWAD